MASPVTSSGRLITTVSRLKNAAYLTAFRMHYVVQIGGFAQYRFAYFEMVTHNLTKDAQSCPGGCGRDLLPRKWAQPYDVDLKQSQKIGDFVFGAGACDFLYSERLRSMIEWHNFKGIRDTFQPIEIRRMGTTKSSASRLKPTLFGARLNRVPVLFDYPAMNAEHNPAYGDPGKPCCTACHGGFYISKYDCIALRPESLTDHDIFISTQELATVLCNQRFRDACIENQISNVEFIPVSEYSYCDPTYDQGTHMPFPANGGYQA